MCRTVPPYHVSVELAEPQAPYRLARAHGPASTLSSTATSIGLLQFTPLAVRQFVAG